MKDEPVVDAALAAFLAERQRLSAAEFDGARAVEALMQAAEVRYAARLAEAEAAAEAMRVAAAAEIEAARQAGYDAGHAAGLRESRQQHATEFARREVGVARRVADADERIAMLVTRTLSKVLTEREHDERFFASVLQRVLRVARDEKFLVVRVAPMQAESARRALDRLLAEAGARPFIDLVVDPLREAGHCTIETAHGSIDASLDTQIEAIREALTSVWRPADV